ncbi:MAG TPA: lytic murein transglycosylase [Solirubrobacterales bacterium]|nr:lytic murein transglycosylase [Solirubrobacterales bacterium]
MDHHGRAGLMRRLAGAVAGVALVLAFAAPGSPAAPAVEPQEPPTTVTPATTETAPSEGDTAASQTEAPAPAPPVQRGDTLAPPPAPAPKPEASGGVTAKPEPAPTPQVEEEPETEDGASEVPAIPPSFSVPLLPGSSCAPSGVPAILIPIYQRASTAYGLGPQGPSVLAAINEIETAFGTNLNVSSAGAVGWMQFMPSSWETYGVDANGDGVKDPFNPEDAIFAAASYLRTAGMPADTYGAVFAYNHADWYVAEVLANAQCYGQLGGAVAGAFELTPKLKVLDCRTAKPWRKRIPAPYLDAFESAAARYDLGRRGVWALAAVTRLESNFGRGMSKAELHRRGPLGLDGSEWQRFAVDGDGDGRIRRETPADSAATLARMIWSQGGLRAGLFEHNHAEWYVDAVLGEAEQIEGECETSTVEWALSLPNAVIAPIDWNNLTLSNDLEKRDLDSGAIDPRIVGLLGAITQSHQITISALRSDHSEYTSEGNVSNHYYGRAMDIAEVDGVSCTDTAPTAPCGELATTLSQLPAPAMPTELIYCYDVDGPGPAFARSDHCDHVHVGYDG